MSSFFPTGRDSRSSSTGQSIHGGGNKQNEERRKFVRKMGDTGGTIRGDISAGHCFVLRDLTPMNFFKQLVIMELKMCTTGKTFG